jgi:hypothetical protein
LELSGECADRTLRPKGANDNGLVCRQARHREVHAPAPSSGLSSEAVHAPFVNVCAVDSVATLLPYYQDRCAATVFAAIEMVFLCYGRKN